ncbi:MAG: Smr/MutS family protein [Treponema sp.]|jgi:DNA mismatch repair protein MutS2|nr:Smr/MutS family protein [Treponema sp.]
MNSRPSEKALGLLEFAAIREAAAARSLSAEAAKIIREEIPLFEPGEAERQKELTAAFHGLLEEGSAGGGDPGRELPSVGFLFPRLAVEGSSLEADEALALGLFIERGEELRRFILGEGRDPVNKGSPAGAEQPRPAGRAALTALAAAAPDCSSLAKEVFHVIDRNGAVRDLPEIKRIRARIKELGRELERVVTRYTMDESTRRMLQSTLPSQRDGRLVLAVKARFRGRFRGIVHEMSATGQTAFVEPGESVEGNNRLLEERAALEREIRRVLRELTGVLARRRMELEDFHRTLIRLEVVRAKARYSLETGGRFAREGEAPALKQARHPLLAAPCPIDFTMGRARMVIITGPNTGGKTAALKTIGLFALMNQAGLALPAAEAVLPVFDAVYADIGDEQSLTQSLSTFSAHITGIAGIIAEATANSLVLLDELGSGTDPEEGGAIAMAALDHFIETKSTVVLTTHHGTLKNYGYSRTGVENASVEFDRQTLSPTYKITMGTPGESRALDIAARNGFPPALVERARGYLREERPNVSVLIAGLTEKRRDLEQAARAAQEEEERLREERRRMELRERGLRERERRLKEEGALEFRRLLSESRKTLENLVREVREGELSREKTVKVKEFLKKLEGDSLALEASLDAEGAAPERPPAEDGGPPAERKALSPGMDVLAGPSRRRGTLIRRDKRGFWIVETGSVKARLPEGELIPAPGDGRRPSPETAPLIAPPDLAPLEVKPELNLLGLRLEEALEALRRQIDGAVLAGLREFAVIHGTGSGVLQKGVQDYLREDPAVEEYRFSRPEQGGFGRTEVVLKG